MSANPSSIAERVQIAPGVLMPRLGLGTYRSEPGPEVEEQVTFGLSIGYRGIDTAALYGNEQGVGRAIHRSGLAREEIFIATKVWNDDQGFDSTLAAFDASLKRLGLDFVDLYLIHWPRPHSIPDTWRAMERLHTQGLARAIGVCNFLEPHLEELAEYATVPVAVNQIEHHPWLQQPGLREYCSSHGITMQAWAPVIRGHAAEIPELVEIGVRHGKSPAQVSIRWILQHGVTTIPKSVHESRIAQNADVFDFDLDDAEMAVIDALDRGQRLGPDPDAMRRTGQLQHS